MELSKRLHAVAAMVTSGNVVCDVGCDHGYVSIFLVKTKKCPKVYALDVREGPLGRAREHVEAYACADYIEVKRSDGLLEMPAGVADTLICAGMGGRLVRKILSESMEKVWAMKELILQPQSELWLVREFIRQSGFLLVEEDMVEEDGKYYPVMRILVPPRKDAGKRPEPENENRPGGEISRTERCLTREKDSGAGRCRMQEEGSGAGGCLTQEEEQAVLDHYGPILLSNRHPVLKEYLIRQEALLEQIERQLEESGGNGEQTRQRKRELEQEKKQVKAALAYYERRKDYAVQ